jgi:hypothetical protein
MTPLSSTSSIPLFDSGSDGETTEAGMAMGM